MPLATIQMRGKFMNTTTPMDPSSSMERSDGDGGEDRRPTDMEEAQQIAAISSDVARASSTNSLFDELDAAESMVVHLLDIAASTADHLSSLAVMNSPLQQHHHHHHHRSSETDHAESHIHQHAGIHRHMDEKLKKNGKEYLDTLKQIHSLLIPYSHLVQAFELNTAGSDDSRKPKEEVMDSMDLTRGDENIYASKLELRLAMEKRNILKEFVKLEEHEIQTVTLESNKSCVTDDTIANNYGTVLGKRKSMQ
jgi:hypothetical protein